MDLLISSSLITAFLAGVAALFAPCCITVLLPAYLASIFKEKRTVFLMTFVFFLGLLTIFLPLGLGFAGLGKFLTRNHTWVFIGGSIIMFALGTMILLGKHISLPVHLPSTKITNTGSVYLLGIFSGIATVCCAPVLAGTLTLSVLPGSVLWGGVYAVVYVLGMVIPLFVIAFFLDETHAIKKLKIFRATMSYSIGARQVHLRIADLISGFTFLLMGVVTVIVAIKNPSGGMVFSGSALQTAVNITASQITDALSRTSGSVPAFAWLIAVGLIILGIVVYAWKRSHDPLADSTKGGEEL